jgi:hypothetical protein
MVDTPQTTATMLTAYFQDGQSAGAIIEGRVRNFVATLGIAINTPIIAAMPPYNVAANGSDQTTALNSALTAAATAGTAVLLPVGQIVINGSGLSMPSGVGMIGQNTFRPYGSTAPTKGTVLISPTASYASGTSPVITMAGNNTIMNLSIWGPGSDGFGSGTSRPNIFASAGNNLLFNASVQNANVGLNGNYQSQQFILRCSFGGNATGLLTPVDSGIGESVFYSNGADVNFGPGGNHNRFSSNRFEFNGSNSSIIAFGGSATSTANTNAATASGNATLHFASAPAGAVQGYQIYNQTNPTSIPAGTYVTSASPATSITMSANATGAGVISGDTLMFYVPAIAQNVFVGNQWDRCFLAAMALSYCNQWIITGNHFARSGAGASSNTVNDCAISLFACNSMTITGNTMNTGQNDGGGGVYSPSFAIWDGGANFNSQIKSNTINYNPVNGTNGGGINVLTTFTNFNTDNAVARANPYQINLP